MTGQVWIWGAFKEASWSASAFGARQQAQFVVQDKKLQGKSRPPKAPKGAQIYPASLPHSMNSRGRNRYAPSLMLGGSP